MSNVHIGIDLGTSGCRAVAVNSERVILAQESVPLPPSRRQHAGWSVQNPDDWWLATMEVMGRVFSKLSATTVDTITVDGTSSTLLLSDHSGNPLTTALMYDDQRAVTEAARISQSAPINSGAHGPSSSLAKLLWLLETDRNIDRSNGLLALHQADWISNRLGRMFGQSDENNALKMGYDPVERNWPKWMDSLDLPPDILPAVSPPGAPYSTLDPELAIEWGIPQGLQDNIHICTGTTDSVAATIAAGINKSGDAVTSLGTTIALKIISPTPLFSPPDGIYSHRLGESWLVSGASNAGSGILLEYFSLQQIEELSHMVEPDIPTGLDYYPLSSTGERFPTSNPNLSPRLTPRPDDDKLFFQGILEGLTTIEKRGYTKMHNLGAPFPTRIVTSGGGADNQGWRAIRQQQIGVPVSVATQTEAAYGAAILPTLHL